MAGDEDAARFDWDVDSDNAQEFAARRGSQPSRPRTKAEWKRAARRVEKGQRAQPWGPDAPYRSVFTNAKGQASLFVAGRGRPQAVIASLVALLAVWGVVDLVRLPSGQQAAPLLLALTAAAVALLFAVLSLSARRHWFLKRSGDAVTVFAAGGLLGMIPLIIVTALVRGSSGTVGGVLAAFVGCIAFAAVIGGIAVRTVLRRGAGRYAFKG